ncbi:MAG: hypothetical protein HY016_06035 [Nitrosomonadales bacterium]|nr:hypothetical protein [Nitrosomonadales bacterium]
MADSAALFNKPIVRWTLFLVTFAFMFVYHTYPLGLSDFWWHLNTGRWIWEHGTMPVDDPFLFTSASPLDARASLILRGYPLSQLLFLGSYAMAGAYALVALKSLLMTLFYWLLWHQLRRNGLHPITASSIVGILPLLFFRFDELRPQVFSFIFTLLVLQLAESILADARRGQTLPRYALLLPVIMLLWANLHRGFIIGIGILLVHLFAEWLARNRNHEPLSADTYRHFAILAIASMLVALFNPVGYTATWASFTEVSGPFSHVIDEFLGTLRYFDFIGMKHIGYLIIATSVVPVLALLFKWRELRIAHLLLLIAFLAAGIMSFRFSLMMVAVVMVISCAYFARDLNRWLTLAKGIPMVLLWCIATGFLANAALSRTSLSASPLETNAIPSSAVDYLAQAKPAGELFNYFEYGGYLSWRLYPQKIFIDQRNLSWDTYEEYSRCWRGDYAGVFGKYRIGVVFYPVYERATGKPSRLILALLNDTQWGIGYYDGRDIIFLRMDLNANQAVLNKSKVIANLLRR